MSKQAAKDWMKKVFTEPDLARRVTGLKEEEEMHALAAEMGYEFTREEWNELSSHVKGCARAYAEEHGIEVSDELTEEQLEAIAGGGAARWILGSIFSYVGLCIGWATGGVAGGIAGAGVSAGALATPGAIAGAVAGGAAGTAAGAAFGDLIGQWVEGG